MSVIFTPRARFSRWKALWPLALLLAVSIIGGIWLWRAWPQVLMQSAVWQRSLNLELSRLLQAVAENPAAALAMAAGTSLTITALALLVHGFRQLAIRLSRHQAPALWKQVSWATLALAGGVILLAAAGVMWLSAVPAGGGIRPF